MSASTTLTTVTTTTLPALTFGDSSAATASQTQVTASSTPNSSGGFTSSSNLYLYTFLATLLLLLGVSGAIVIRSFVLRRRHQALIEEAIRNGTWVPPTFIGGVRGARRRDVGEKPKMWEAWLWARPGNEADGETNLGDESKGKGQVGSEWGDILPISATYLSTKTLRSSNSNPTSNNGIPSNHSAPRSRSIFPWRREAYIPPASLTNNTSNISSPILNTSSTPAETGSSTPADGTSTPTSKPKPTPTLRLTVLIAMPAPPTNIKPSASQAQLNDDDEEGPPVVEFGMVDVPVRSQALGSGSGGDSGLGGGLGWPGDVAEPGSGNGESELN